MQLFTCLLQFSCIFYLALMMFFFSILVLLEVLLVLLVRFIPGHIFNRQSHTQSLTDSLTRSHACHLQKQFFLVTFVILGDGKKADRQ